MAITASEGLLVNRFRGCLVGSLIGDCLGAPFEGEFPVSKTVLSRYMLNLLNKAHEERSQPLHSYTDDTAMTFSVARSLIEKKCFNPKDMAKKFVEEYYNNSRRGYGSNVVDVFSSLKESDYSDVFAAAKQQFNGAGSYGNGGAMRISPVSLYSFQKSEQDLMVAKNCALITHAHPNGYNGAILQCLAVHRALTINISNEIVPLQFTASLLEKMERIEDTESNRLTKNKPFCESLCKIQEIFLKKQENISPEEIAEYLGNDVSAVKSVPTAIYCFLRSFKPLKEFETENPFVRAIYLSIAVGGDTDTIASMSGSIAGAYHGMEAIPLNLQSYCEGLDESISLANKLFNLFVQNN